VRIRRLKGRIGHIYPIRRRIGHIYSLRKLGDFSGRKGKVKDKITKIK